MQRNSESETVGGNLSKQVHGNVAILVVNLAFKAVDFVHVLRLVVSADEEEIVGIEKLVRKQEDDDLSTAIRGEAQRRRQRTPRAPHKKSYHGQQSHR